MGNTAPKTVMVKHLLHTYFIEVDHPSIPGAKALREQIGRLGEEIEVTRQQDLARGHELDAYYTDKEAEQIKAGSYRGFDSAAVYAARGGQKPTPLIQPADGEGQYDISEMAPEDIAALINPAQFDLEGSPMNVDATIDLAGDAPTLEILEKVLDAEILATNNEPRKGVQNALEAKMTALTQG